MDKEINYNSNYYSIIPMQVLLDKKLTDREKLIYAELTSLDSKKGYAWASNKYIAELFEMNEISVSRCLKHLQETGYIKCTYEENNFRQIVLTKGLTPLNPTVNPSKPYGLDPLNPTVNKESIDEKVNKESIDENTMLATTNEVLPKFVEYFAKTCPSLPQIKSLTDNRKKAIKNILKRYSKKDLMTVMQKAEASEFLSGRNGKWCNCNIDWLLKPNNFIKVLEGNYDNERTKTNEKDKIDLEYKKTIIEKNRPLSEKVAKSFDNYEVMLDKMKEMGGKTIDVDNSG